MTTLDALRIHLHRTAAARRAPAKPAPRPRRDTHSRHNRAWTDAELAVVAGATSADDAMQRLPGRTHNAVRDKLQNR